MSSTGLHPTRVLRRSPRRLALTATTLLAALLAPVATLSSAPAAHAAEGDVVLNLLLTNDFHGRINTNTVRWAWKVEDLRATTPADGGLMIGAGDLIGASEFASAVADDQPTIDVMNEIGLDASAVGNHEFDQGWADLRDDVMGPTDPADPEDGAPAAWDYLGANVYARGTTTPVLDEYEIYDINGVDVAVIGAVTAETASLVSPGGISTIDFGDPIDAVNRVAGQLSDGDDANGEADVIVATFHQGAAVGAGSTYEQEIAKGGEFADMADLDPAINVVFNGHTHQTYAWDAPVTGGDLATRPFLQTGSYGTNIGQVVLTYNTVSGSVTGYTVANRAVPTTGDTAPLIAQYPDRLTPVNDTVTAALAHAADVGNEPVGSVTADITTAFSGGSYVDGKYVGGTRDDRAAESTLGDLVANALRDGIPADIGEADLGIVNPGGLRNELLFAGDPGTNPANTDGVVTYAEANGVLPFVNNIWLIDLTGAQLKQVLEQQWQRNADGTIPTRPYLALGLSDNVTVTRDPSRAEGDRITSVVIDGQRLSPRKTYTVSTFSFLGTGGDNFRAFTEGTARDTGLVDRDLWIGYLTAHEGLGPDFARQQVDESGMPRTVYPGQTVSFTVGAATANPAPPVGKTASLDLTSLGSPLNTGVTVYALRNGQPLAIGTAPVTGGAATVSLRVPLSVDAASSLWLVATPSNTSAGKVDVAPITATAEPMSYGTPGQVMVTLTPDDATGTVEVFNGATSLGEDQVIGGAATVVIPGTALRPGTYRLRVAYSGDDDYPPATTYVDLTVAKATPDLTVVRTPQKVIVNQTRAKLQISLDSAADTVTGRVAVTTDGDTYLKRLSAGAATITLRPFDTTGRHDVLVEYLGDDLNAAVDKSIRIYVSRK